MGDVFLRRGDKRRLIGEDELDRNGDIPSSPAPGLTGVTGYGAVPGFRGKWKRTDIHLHKIFGNVTVDPIYIHM